MTLALKKSFPGSRSPLTTAEVVRLERVVNRLGDLIGQMAERKNLTSAFKPTLTAYEHVVAALKTPSWVDADVHIGHARVAVCKASTMPLSPGVHAELVAIEYRLLNYATTGR